ncbi:biopolymer transport protein ExbD [Haloferula luteola]|uniref:Biopolymer transport protein ExbD n=1 Tax=Haloferula luteola TaxID=595692 RepID=A0A840VID5_9BACT|nr:biopolymer transporter ExbD [Haloferula luteola]MBB5353549.1 biopolymer transport protein ExbD [Haloferula luteola]
MARHKHSESAEEDLPKLDISSLIDATFLLLIYFLVTTTIQPREQDVPMTLPAAAPSEKPPEIEPKLIKIDASGAIFVGTGAAQLAMDADDNRSVPLLFADLQAYSDLAKSSGQEALVQIYVDGSARQQRVIDVLNALAGVGITKVTFTDLVDP